MVSDGVHEDAPSEACRGFVFVDIGQHGNGVAARLHDSEHAFKFRTPRRIEGGEHPHPLRHNDGYCIRSYGQA